jgi:hypothetical protein
MTDAPTLSPAVDYFTRTPNGPFLDTGIEVNFGMKGHVYIAVSTLREMAEIAGLIGEQKDPEAMNLHEIAIYNRGLKDGLARGEELREHLSGILAHLGPVDSGDDPADPPAPAGSDVPVADAPTGEGDAAGTPVGDPPKRGARGKARDAGGREGADGVSGDGSHDDGAFRI